MEDAMQVDSAEGGEGDGGETEEAAGQEEQEQDEGGGAEAEEEEEEEGELLGTASALLISKASSDFELAQRATERERERERETDFPVPSPSEDSTPLTSRLHGKRREGGGGAFGSRSRGGRRAPAASRGSGGRRGSVRASAEVEEEGAYGGGSSSGGHLAPSARLTGSSSGGGGGTSSFLFALDWLEIAGTSETSLFAYGKEGKESGTEKNLGLKEEDGGATGEAEGQNENLSSPADASLPPVPTLSPLHPSEEEFEKAEDILGLIEKAARGEEGGLENGAVLIVPPEGCKFSPPRDQKHLRFEVREQKTHRGRQNGGPLVGPAVGTLAALGGSIGRDRDIERERETGMTLRELAKVDRDLTACWWFPSGPSKGPLAEKKTKPFPPPLEAVESEFWRLTKTQIDAVHTLTATAFLPEAAEAASILAEREKAHMERQAAADAVIAAGEAAAAARAKLSEQENTEDGQGDVEMGNGEEKGEEVKKECAPVAVRPSEALETEAPGTIPFLDRLLASPDILTFPNSLLETPKEEKDEIGGRVSGAEVREEGTETEEASAPRLPSPPASPPTVTDPVPFTSSRHLHAGCLFSCSPWTLQSSHTLTVAVLHWGMPRVWLVTAPADAPKVAKLLLASELGSAGRVTSTAFSPRPPALLLPPSLLIKNGVRVRRIVQRAGETVMVFPGSFVSCLCSGLSLCEKATVAPAFLCNDNLFLMGDAPKSGGHSGNEPAGAGELHRGRSDILNFFLGAKGAVGGGGEGLRGSAWLGVPPLPALVVAAAAEICIADIEGSKGCDRVEKETEENAAREQGKARMCGSLASEEILKALGALLQREIRLRKAHPGGTSALRLPLRTLREVASAVEQAQALSSVSAEGWAEGHCQSPASSGPVGSPQAAAGAHANTGVHHLGAAPVWVLKGHAAATQSGRALQALVPFRNMISAVVGGQFLAAEEEERLLLQSPENREREGEGEGETGGARRVKEEEGGDAEMSPVGDLAIKGEQRESLGSSIETEQREGKNMDGEKEKEDEGEAEKGGDGLNLEAKSEPEKEQEQKERKMMRSLNKKMLLYLQGLSLLPCFDFKFPQAETHSGIVVHPSRPWELISPKMAEELLTPEERAESVFIYRFPLVLLRRLLEQLSAVLIDREAAGEGDEWTEGCVEAVFADMPSETEIANLELEGLRRGKDQREILQTRGAWGGGDRQNLTDEFAESSLDIPSVSLRFLRASALFGFLEEILEEGLPVEAVKNKGMPGSVSLVTAPAVLPSEPDPPDTSAAAPNALPPPVRISTSMPSPSGPLSVEPSERVEESGEQGLKRRSGEGSGAQSVMAELEREELLGLLKKTRKPGSSPQKPGSKARAKPKAKSSIVRKPGGWPVKGAERDPQRVKQEAEGGRDRDRDDASVQSDEAFYNTQLPAHTRKLSADESTKLWVDQNLKTAIKLCRERGKASTLQLQREFKIGAMRAQALLRRLTEEKIVLPAHKSTGHRVVLDENGREITPPPHHTKLLGFGLKGDGPGKGKKRKRVEPTESGQEKEEREGEGGEDAQDGESKVDDTGTERQGEEEGEEEGEEDEEDKEGGWERMAAQQSGGRVPAEFDPKGLISRRRMRGGEASVSANPFRRLPSLTAAGPVVQMRMPHPTGPAPIPFASSSSSAAPVPVHIGHHSSKGFKGGTPPTAGDLSSHLFRQQQQQQQSAQIFPGDGDAQRERGNGNLLAASRGSPTGGAPGHSLSRSKHAGGSGQPSLGHILNFPPPPHMQMLQGVGAPLYPAPFATVQHFQQGRHSRPSAGALERVAVAVSQPQPRQQGGDTAEEDEDEEEDEGNEDEEEDGEEKDGGEEEEEEEQEKEEVDSQYSLG
uniref:JmjC domain-containing protein n=1 Tax=Chromera velia CCMP2878 TaxID=1169474 RepID=A0A0G4F823_9ALVE|eukprot:Cvel_15643.t1-p1 / transcript=Cvel_15643.t1 / gene=Cvel_15643 / organism=Chromera_velia_CCMP2878 / gene_product=hypothetical protein / transcript_product=hypothetical protein / location=Cvel_scaffold1166:39430-49725(-) / protein_length=1848 / sequence_SO=supercontig / SO=protein_coding / is_pseudo=false